MDFNIFGKVERVDISVEVITSTKRDAFLLQSDEDLKKAAASVINSDYFDSLPNYNNPKDTLYKLEYSYKKRKSKLERKRIRLRLNKKKRKRKKKTAMAIGNDQTDA
jgi:hypothetical protein